jgi:hypothetical protein
MRAPQMMLDIMGKAELQRPWQHTSISMRAELLVAREMPTTTYQFSFLGLLFQLCDKFNAIDGTHIYNKGRLLLWQSNMAARSSNSKRIPAFCGQ